MSTTLVIGGSGFIGRNLVESLGIHARSRNERTICADTRQAALGRGVFSRLDATDRAALKAVLAEHRPTRIVQLVGLFRPADHELVYQLNAGISHSLFESAIELKLELDRIIVMGTAAEYGKPSALPLTESSALAPVNDYGLCKKLQTDFAEYYWRVHGLPIVVARAFNAAGKGISTDLSIGSFARQIRQSEHGDVIKVGNIRSKRDYLMVEDIAAALVELLYEGKAGEAYNICSGYSVSMEDLLSRMIRASGKDLRIEVDEARLKLNDVPDIYGSYAKIEAATGWKPRHDILAEIGEVVTSD